MKTDWKITILSTLLLVLTALPAFAQTENVDRTNHQNSTSPLLLAHYMPWYVAKPTSEVWGWHWTMNHFDPDKQVNGKREIASKLYPLIGPYDSGDPHVVEYHLLTMKLAGIDGVIVDWYGLTDLHDYGILHQNTKRLFEIAARYDMRFAVCYEDKTIKALVEAEQINQDEQVDHAIKEIRWLKENWFRSQSYLRANGYPVLLSFGNAGLSNDQWKQCIDKLGFPIHYFSEHDRREGAIGAFDWPIPAEGTTSTQRFLKSRHDWQQSIPVAYPRFLDVYEEANVHPSWGSIDDAKGKTFKTTLNQAISSGASLIQIATWNDWGEGTVIEPSAEYGYRDLALIQETRRNRIDREFHPNSLDLELPRQLLKLRKRLSHPKHVEKLDEIARQISDGKLNESRMALASLTRQSSNQKTIYAMEKDIAYRTGDELTEYMKQRCRLDVYYPTNQKNFSTVVWFHGGGLKNGQRFVPEELKEKGIAVVAVNYRLSPQAKSPAYLQDAAAAVAWTFRNIAKYGGSADQIFVSGHSAGGYLASMVGIDRRWLAEQSISPDQLAGLIPLSGHTITHMTVRAERGIPKHQAVVDDMAPVFHVNKNAPPMLLITGDRELEMLGRYEETAYFWRMMKITGHPDVHLIELPGKDHGQMLKPSFPLMLQFMDRIVGDQ